MQVLDSSEESYTITLFRFIENGRHFNQSEEDDNEGRSLKKTND